MLFLIIILRIETFSCLSYLGFYPFLSMSIIYISLVYEMPYTKIINLLVFGFLQDGFYDYPIGYSNCQLLTLSLFLTLQRKNYIISNVTAQWIYFAIFLFMSCSLKILGKLWLEDYILSIKTLAFSWLITVSLFPLINKSIFWVTIKLFSPTDRGNNER